MTTTTTISLSDYRRLLELASQSPIASSQEKSALAQQLTVVPEDVLTVTEALKLMADKKGLPDGYVLHDGMGVEMLMVEYDSLDPLYPYCAVDSTGIGLTYAEDGKLVFGGSGLREGLRLTFKLPDSPTE